MSETTRAHTPGPWHWEWHDESLQSLSGSDAVSDHVLSVSPCESCQKTARDRAKSGNPICLGPSLADMTLIATAPELLEKLKEIHGGMACSCKLQPFVGGPVPCGTCQIGALIAKAEGRAA